MQRLSEVLTYENIFEKPINDKLSDRIIQIHSNKRILITGGVGSIGKSILTSLSKVEGIEIVVLDINENQLYLNSLKFVYACAAKFCSVLILLISVCSISNCFLNLLFVEQLTLNLNLL